LFLVDEATAKSKYNIFEKTTEISLKYSYPVLWIFKTLFCNRGTRYRAKTRRLSIEKP